MLKVGDVATAKTPVNSNLEALDNSHVSPSKQLKKTTSNQPKKDIAKEVKSEVQNIEAKKQ